MDKMIDLRRMLCSLVVILMVNLSGYSQLVISELHYHPAEVDLPFPNYDDREEAEFVELWNASATTIDISLYSFRGISYCFPAGTTILSNQRLVLAKDETIYTTVYGGTPFGVYGGQLSNSGELVQLFDNNGLLVHQVNYLDNGNWPSTPDGQGTSLELLCTNCNTELFSNWGASTSIAGHTAGANNSLLTTNNLPNIDSLTISTTTPNPNEQITITVQSAFATSVELIYSLNYDSSFTISGNSNVGLVQFTLPGFTANDIIHYQIVAQNQQGAFSLPRADDNSPKYSILVKDPNRATSNFPIMNWYYDATSPDSALTTIEYNGQLVSNAFSWWRRNKHWRVELPKGQEFEFPGLTTLKVDEFQLNRPDHMFGWWVNGTMARTAVFTNIMSEEGEPALDAFNIRVDENGQYGKIWTYLTWPDGNWRSHVGITEGHEYFKFPSTRVHGIPNPDIKFPEGGDTISIYNLMALADSVGPHLMDVYDIPKMVNFAALSTLVCHWDAGLKNFYMHKHPNGRWEGDIWDVDASPRTGVAETDSTWCKCAELPGMAPGLVTPAGNPIIPNANNDGNMFAKPLLANNPRVQEMYYRRLRTLIDKYYAPGELMGRVMAQADSTDPDILYTANSYSVNHNIAAHQHNIFVDYPAWQLPRYAAKPGFPGTASGLTNVVINEIQYAPIGGDQEEFIELYNNSLESIDLSGWQLEGVGITFPHGTVILPEDFLVVASWSPTFIDKYGSGKYVAADFEGNRLKNEGETLRLVRADGAIEDEVSYAQAGWKGANGGPSLERIDYNAASDLASNWAPSAAPFGTPDAPNNPDTTADYPPETSTIELVINEIMYNPAAFGELDGSNFDFLELINNTSTAVDVSNVQIRGIDYQFPTGSILQPGQIIVLASDAHSFMVKYGFEPYDSYNGKLNNSGEQLTVVSATGITIDEVTYDDTNPWDELPDGHGPSLELLNPSFDNSDPLSWFRSADAWGTPGQVNSDICLGVAEVIVINEINYNSNNSVLDPGDWVELYNPNPTAVNLSGWTFHDNGFDFVFPVNTVVEPNEYLVLVEDSLDFKQAFPHMNAGAYIGNLGFKLNNDGERMSLFSPSKCLSDYVIYRDSLPWPMDPDGLGPTLSLMAPELDNGLPASWESSFAINSSFGTPGRSNTPCPTVELFHPDTVCVNKPYVFKVNPIEGVRNEWIFPGGTPATYTGDSVSVEFSFAFPIQIELNSYFHECEDNQLSLVQVVVCNEPPIAINDFYTLDKNTTVVGNVTDNDQNIVPNAYSTSLVNSPTNGTLTFNNDGTFLYEPDTDFVGTDDFIYWVCDEGYEGECRIAFVTFSVLETCTSLNVSVWLEGAYNLVANEMTTTLNITHEVLPGMAGNLLENGQPYSIAPWSYNGLEGDGWETADYPPSMVDWVLVSLRTSPLASSEQFKGAGLLDKSGGVQLLDPCALEGLIGTDYYIVVEHRNHVAAMTPSPVSITNRTLSYDFRSTDSYANGGAGQKQIAPGVWAMYGGDGSQESDQVSFDINGLDKNFWVLFNGIFSSYQTSDFNLDGDVNGMDKILWSGNNGVFSSVPK